MKDSLEQYMDKCFELNEENLKLKKKIENMVEMTAEEAEHIYNNLNRIYTFLFGVLIGMIIVVLVNHLNPVEYKIVPIEQSEDFGIGVEIESQQIESY